MWRYLYFTWVFSSSATSYFHSATFWGHNTFYSTTFTSWRELLVTSVAHLQIMYLMASPGRSPFLPGPGRHRSCCWWSIRTQRHTECWTRRERSPPAASEGREAELQRNETSVWNQLTAALLPQQVLQEHLMFNHLTSGCGTPELKSLNVHSPTSLRIIRTVITVLLFEAHLSESGVNAEREALQ